MKRWMQPYAKKLFLHSLQGLRGGFLELVCPDRTYVFGDPSSELRAMAVVHDERFFTRAITGADVGIGESYMEGEWTSPDTVALVRVATRNLRLFDTNHGVLSALRRGAFRLQHALRNNSLTGSRENIRAHYDLGNEFYRLFLDEQMQYSSAYFNEASDSLETAQKNKMDRICQKLAIEPGDRVLEIGCGWGGFALHAARNYGAHVTGVTISRAQYDYAVNEAARETSFPGSVTFVLEDYRTLRGQFDKIVSVEMFEAVGLAHYDEFFTACDSLLAPGGGMLLQTITMPDQELANYKKRVDWIQMYIFPGSELAYVGEIHNSLRRATQMRVSQTEKMGLHYAQTLNFWRERFFQRLQDVQELGFDERFQRMWDFYLSWCEGAFLERYIDVLQIVMAKAAREKAAQMALPEQIAQELTPK